MHVAAVVQQAACPLCRLSVPWHRLSWLAALHALSARPPSAPCAPPPSEALQRPSTPASSQVLAREVLHSRKAVSRLYVNKAHMMSINNALTEQLGACALLCCAVLYCAVLC